MFTILNAKYNILNIILPGPDRARRAKRGPFSANLLKFPRTTDFFPCSVLCTDCAQDRQQAWYRNCIINEAKLRIKKPTGGRGLPVKSRWQFSTGKIHGKGGEATGDRHAEEQWHI